MKVTFLGTGTSTGVPEIGCGCEVCTSTDPKDSRLRSSVLIENDDNRLLIDCGPDFRAQMLRRPFKKIDAVLLTHKHYDHVGGLDDLRPFCRRGDIPVYADAHTLDCVKGMFPYCFTEVKYPGVPNLLINTIEKGKTSIYLSVRVNGSTLNVGKKGLNILFEDGTKFTKAEASIDTKVSRRIRHRADRTFPRQTTHPRLPHRPGGIHHRHEFHGTKGNG